MSWQRIATPSMLDVALLHYPVCNARQEIIGSAVTNLDIHDIARVSRSYGVRRYFVVTPYAEQQKLAGEIIDHWRSGYGARHNPDRKEAFSIVSVCPSLDEVYAGYAGQGLERPLTVATSAMARPKTIGFAALRQRLADGEHCLLLFGTASGLAPEVMESVDVTLPPVGSRERYNHLSVRSACAIVLDRLLGDR